MDGSPFQLAHADFYERPDAIDVSGDYLNLLRLGLPRSWRIEVAGWWTHAYPRERSLPDQGFKIHLSSTPTQALSLLRRVMPVLLHRRVGFKVVTGPELLVMGLGKNYGRGASGKFVTVYPVDDAEFRSLLESLHAATGEFEGPYILSDMRYADSRVLFYRYGAFRSESRLRVDGTEEDLLKLPDGRWVEDRRLPFYRLPEGIEEPFARPSDISRVEPPLLDGRFRVSRALKFSNAGGVYLALDERTGDEVILKEARPGIGLVDAGDGRQLDAQALLTREFAVLQQAAASGRTPRPIAMFEQGGHRYIAISRLAGQVLRSFRARDDVLLLGRSSSEEVDEFVQSFARMAANLIDAVRAVHACGVVICDFSPSNVLVDLKPDGSLALSLIDFESSWLEAWGTPDPIALRWGTPGYRRPLRNQLDTSPTQMRAHDWFSVALSLYSCLIPNNGLFELDPQMFEPMLELVCQTWGLPASMGELLRALREADLDAAHAALAALGGVQGRACTPVRPFRCREARESLHARLVSTLPQMHSYLLEVMDDTREDRLWPAGSEVFLTHPLGLAHGAAGVLAFLVDAGLPVPERALAWWRRQPDGPGRLPPGLFNGSAGVAYVCHLVGEKQRALRLFRQSAEHPLRGADPSWFNGEAGLGHAALSMHLLCGEPWLLELAADCAQRLRASARSTTAGCSWPHAAGAEGRPGMALGGACIGLFLAQYGDRAGADWAIDLAVQAARQVVASGQRERGRTVWYVDEHRRMHTPYLYAGAAGIGSALLRIAALTGERAFLEVGLEACESAYSPLVVGSDLFQGMAGIAEAQLDAYLANGDALHLERAFHLADSILRCQVKRASGIAQPGVASQRIQCDLAGGAAGVGGFLVRLQTLGPRRFFDLPVACPVGQPNASLEHSEALELG
jgi:hypothetical protein